MFNKIYENVLMEVQQPQQQVQPQQTQQTQKQPQQAQQAQQAQQTQKQPQQPVAIRRIAPEKRTPSPKYFFGNRSGLNDDGTASWKGVGGLNLENIVNEFAVTYEQRIVQGGNDKILYELGKEYMNGGDPQKMQQLKTQAMANMTARDKQLKIYPPPKDETMASRMWEASMPRRPIMSTIPNTDEEQRDPEHHNKANYSARKRGPYNTELVLADPKTGKVIRPVLLDMIKRINIPIHFPRQELKSQKTLDQEAEEAQRSEE